MKRICFPQIAIIQCELTDEEEAKRLVDSGQDHNKGGVDLASSSHGYCAFNVTAFLLFCYFPVLPMYLINSTQLQYPTPSGGGTIINVSTMIDRAAEMSRR